MLAISKCSKGLAIKNHQLPYKKKKKMYKAFVVSILPAGCESWTLMKREREKKKKRRKKKKKEEENAVETKCLQRLLDRYRTTKFVRACICPGALVGNLVEENTFFLIGTYYSSQQSMTRTSRSRP